MKAIPIDGIYHAELYSDSMKDIKLM